MSKRNGFTPPRPMPPAGEHAWQHRLTGYARNTTDEERMRLYGEGMRNMSDAERQERAVTQADGICNAWLPSDAMKDALEAMGDRQSKRDLYGVLLAAALAGLCAIALYALTR